MKAILMSIKPKWCEKIFNGEKTIEVRKTAPKLKPPFKVYVYETKYRLGNKFINEVLNTVYDGGKVVGEFVCDNIENFIKWNGGVLFKRFMALHETCLSVAEMLKYMGNRDKVVGWHITASKRYDTPKELWEFTPWCEKSRIAYDNLELCCDCPNAAFGDDGTWYGCRVTRPPQSWCYVEEIE